MLFSGGSIVPLVLSLAGVLAAAGAHATERPPSVLLIVSDDQRWDTIGEIHDVGGDTPVMPTIDALAAQGVLFTNAFVSAPHCGPSRAALLTGQYPHRSGILAGARPFGGAFVLREKDTIATWLDAAGYRTGLYGFYQFEYGQIWPEIPPGWDEWHVTPAGRFYDFRLLENGQGFDRESNFFPSGCTAYQECPGDLGGCPNPVNHQTTVLLQRALDFLDAQAVDEPFFLMFAPVAPHMPACPLPEDRGAFAGVSPYRPPSFNEPDASDKPLWNRAACPMSVGDVILNDARRKLQLESLRGLDRAVETLLEKLEQMNRSDDTVVVYTSDNGYRWGEHCMTGKPCPHDECLRVPLVVRYPEAAPGGRIVSRLVNLVDVAPTLAELTGATTTHAVDGLSFAGLLRGGASPARTVFPFGDWRRPDDFSDGSPDFSGVRTLHYKFVQYETGETELYDLRSDPFELENRADAPAYEQTQRILEATLASFGPTMGCGDGRDNDGDGFADHPADPGCTSPDDLSERSAALVCDDGLDNDQDGAFDWEDPACSFPWLSLEDPACLDGVDNDGDSRVDADGGAAVWGSPIAPPDPHCDAATDNREAPGCGLGAELVLLALFGRRIGGHRAFSPRTP